MPETPPPVVEVVRQPRIVARCGSTGELVPGVPNRDLRRLKLDVLELEWRTDATRSTVSATTPLTVLPHLATILGCLTTSTTGGGVSGTIAVVRS